MKNNFTDKNSIIDKDSIVYENVFIIGNSQISKGAIIYPNTIIKDSFIGENSIIKASYIEDSIILNNVQVGPYAHLRERALIKDNCKIGNFVEVKNSIINMGTKASHLAYIGDCEIGENCNIGCGVIFANYNGRTKNKSIVGKNCFIGSNSNIIAPVNIADNTYICAGTTLTKNTKKNDFVIGRTREIIKENRAQNYLKEV